MKLKSDYSIKPKKLQRLLLKSAKNTEIRKKHSYVLKLIFTMVDNDKNEKLLKKGLVLNEEGSSLHDRCRMLSYQ